jgi:hypothetical protein
MRSLVVMFFGLSLLILAIASGGLSGCASSPRKIDLQRIGKQLNEQGVEGWIHGDAPSEGLFVLTYRNPDDFFDFVQISLLSRDPAIRKQLSALKRHDRVRVRGHLIENPSPQPHLEVSSIELIKKYEPLYSASAYPYETKIPEDLADKTDAVFLVHAVASEGHILVVEYKDAVLPIFAPLNSVTQNLYRNDVVRLRFKFQSSPKRPVHLELDGSNGEPVRVLDSIRSKNGKPGSIEGALVLFPKSPEILFNVFAVQEKLRNGLERQYTLVNFDDPELFKQIRATLQKAWDKYPHAYVNGRNKLLSTRIRVKATGTFSEVDPSQANPQILLNSLDALHISEE